jgi:two-component system, OmpR family, sensor histidine kinase VicK
VVCELVTDERGVIAGAGAEAAALLAVERIFLVGKPLAAFVAGTDRRRFRTLLLDLDEPGRTIETSLEFTPRRRDALAAHVVGTREDGRIVWRLEAAEREPADEPVPAATAPAPTDRWATRLLTRLPHGVVVVDSELTIVFANPAARRLFAGSAVRVGDPLPDPWPTFSLRAHAQTLFGPRPRVGRRVLDVGDRALAVEAMTSADTQTALLMVEDITRQERTRRAEREFVENASHELRTPVSAILSVIEALESGAKDEPELRDQFLGHLRSQADRLARLASSLLLLARVQRGADHPHLDLIPARDFLEEVAADVVRLEGVRVRVEAPPTAAVLADRDLLRHAVDNVVANAAKYTHEGTIRLIARDLGELTELEIGDTGPGMEAAEAAQAFERFYRPSRSQGVGLGLAIAREAVHALDGSIQIDSEPGAGTRVRIHLPSARLLQ